MKAKFLSLLFISGTILILVLLDGCISCNRSQDEPVAAKKIKTESNIEKDSIKIFSLAIGDSIVISKNTDLKSNRYVIEYWHPTILDTTININGHTIKLTNTFNMTRSYTLPLKYAWDTGLNGVKIYYSQSEIILNDNKESTRDTLLINERAFYPLLSQGNEQVKEYGVLLGLQVDQVNASKNTFAIHYSYAIPFTDIGVQVMAIIDLKTKSFSTAIE